MTTILICTVGGSHQPIVTAISKQPLDHVIFICTDKDPATGKSGSLLQIEGKGSCIKAQHTDANPTLPNIPAQTGLSPERYTVCTTLSDDLDQIYQDCSVAIRDALSQFPNAKLIADYTGGTKSMSAGLVMAVLEHQEIDLQLVTGGRSDLIKVQDGSQYAAVANIEQVKFERTIAPYRQAWNRYAYSEALAGLNQLSAPRSSQLRSQYTRFRELSRAFAEWDNFNHPQAASILQNYAANLPDSFKAYWPTLQSLNDINPHKRTAARLYDLYLNAQRRAAQGRYDDAIARVYRLWEWTAQWLLESQCGIKTANILPEQIPEAMMLRPNREGLYQAGLFEAWQLVKHKTSGTAAEFIKAQESRLLAHLKIRNTSILAHGFEPITRENWQTIQTWQEQTFLPMLHAEAVTVGIKHQPLQLPDHYSG